MRGMNKVMLIGRLGHDPEIRSSRAGEPFCCFSVATNRSRKTGDGEWAEETDWHEIRVFGRTVDACSRFLKRGSQVGIEGTLAYNKWTDKEGNKRVSARVLADRVSFLGDLKPRDEVVAHA